MALDRTGMALGEKEIKIQGKDVKIKTNIGDVRNYLKGVQRLKDGNGDDIIDFQFDFLEKIIKQGNPDEDMNFIKQYVEEYFTDLITEALIALRLTTRKDLKDGAKVKELKN